MEGPSQHEAEVLFLQVGAVYSLHMEEVDHCDCVLLIE